MNVTQKDINQLAFEIIGCAIEVHQELGPGLLESIYEECLVFELKDKGFDVKNQFPIPIIYKGRKVKNPLVIDILVNDLVIIELKSKKIFHAVDTAQILSYMKLAKVPKGLLINFNVTNITKEGLIPYVNEYFNMLF